MEPKYDITLKDFPKGTFFGKDFTGEHKDISKVFDDRIKIAQKFCIKSPDYCIVGIYFDNPKINPTNYKATIGFFREKDEIINKELEDYLIEQKYKKVEFKPTKTLYGEIHYKTMEEMFQGIKTYYEFFAEEAKKGKFKEAYKNWNNQKEACIEIYEGMDLIKVYEPTEDTSQFLIHDAFKA